MVEQHPTCTATTDSLGQGSRGEGWGEERLDEVLRWFERRANSVVDAPAAVPGTAPPIPVLTVGFPVLRLLPEQGEIAGIGLDTPLEEVTDVVSVADGPLLVLYPTWAGEIPFRRLRTAAAALETGRVVARGTSLPPLAGGVLAALASAVSSGLAGIGPLVAALPALEDELVVAARMASVARLESPEPSLWQHVQSWSPGADFLVTVRPAPRVQRVRRGSLIRLDIPRHCRSWGLAVAEARAWPGWVDDLVDSFPEPPALARVEPTLLGPRWAGTDQLAEAVACPLELGEVTRRATATMPEPAACSWCGEAVIAATACPCCGMRQVSPLAVGGSR